MLRFNRVTSTAVNLRIRFLQQLASRSAGTSAAAVSLENQPTEKFIPSVEQLHNKYKNEIHNNKLANIFDVIERIEWGGDTISGKVWQRATVLLVDTQTNLSTLTDRQLAQVLYAFGDKCDGVPMKKKSEALIIALNVIQQRGIKLGPLSRTAVFTTKVDNGENPSVTDELQAWESAGLTPTVEILQQFARAYALEGNVQGVVDIMTHMKTSQMHVDENVAGALIYALVLKGQVQQAEAVAKTFSATLNETALQSAIADGLIKTGQFEEAIDKVSSLASSSKIQYNGENTRHVLRVICNLIENGIHDAFHKFSAYLSTSPDGRTLSEKNNNGFVFVRARNARCEGNLAAALEIYSFIHPNYKNEIFEQRTMDSFAEYLRMKEHNITEIVNLLDKLCSVTHIQNPNTFLIQAALRTPNWVNVFQNLKKDLPEILKIKPELKKDLSKAILPELSSGNLTDERRAHILADLATILFTKTEGDDEIEDISRIIYVAAGRDVPHVISALKLIAGDRISREMATAVIQQILATKGDALQKEKLEKLVNSGAVESINATRIQAQLKRLLKAKTDSNAQHVALIAKLIGLSFSASHQRMSENYASNVLISIITDPNISTNRLNSLVEHLEQEPAARLSRDDVLDTKNKLAELKLDERVEFLEKLKAQGQTYSRWMASSVASLEDELANMEGTGKMNPSAIHKLQEVILKKLIREKDIDFALTERILRKATQSTESEDKKGLARLKKQASVLWEKVFLVALQQGRSEVAEQLWEIKSSFSAEAAISYIALEFVKNNVEQADGACAEFISSAQSVTPGSLELASKIVADYDASKVDALAKYLKDKLHLKNNMSRRIVSQIRRKQLRELIENGQLENAFELAVEETSATGAAFGQHELFRASFDRKDTGMTEKVYKMVMNAHDKNNAILDLAFAMLEHGMAQHGENLFLTNELSISPKKLEYFVNRCVQMQRPDMLKSMLFSLNNNRNVALADLNKILIQIIKIYYTNNSSAELEELEAKLKEVSYPMDHHIQKIFENRRKESSDAQ